VMSDPEKNPRAASMVMAMAAMWLCDPNSTEIVTFPQIWKEAFAIAASCMIQVEKTLSVNPSMIPQGNAGKKPTQAQISQEQQVAHESSVDAVTILESGLLNELLQWFYDLDYQHRDESLMVEQFGTAGMHARMELIPPVQVGKHYSFKWFGTEGQKTVQQVQNQIAALNVMKQVPPEQLNGRRIDAGPLLEQIALNAFGPQLAPKILVDQRHSLTVPAQIENELLLHGVDVPVQPLDDDTQHILAHQAAMKLIKDEHGLIRKHIMEHVAAMTKKQAGAQQAQQGAGPRPGAQPQAPMGGQRPPGLMHQDAVQDSSRMPRARN